MHLYNGLMPDMEKGRHPRSLKPMGVCGGLTWATRQSPSSKMEIAVVVPFTISWAASVFFCKKGLFSLCNTSNPNAEIARKAMGQSCPPGIVFRILTHAGRIRGRTGRIHARPLRRTSGPIKKSRRECPMTRSTVSLRYIPHRIHGRRELSDGKRRHSRCVGMRPRGAIRNSKRMDVRSGTRNRDR